MRFELTEELGNGRNRIALVYDINNEVGTICGFKDFSFYNVAQILGTVVQVGEKNYPSISRCDLVSFGVGKAVVKRTPLADITRILKLISYAISPWDRLYVPGKAQMCRMRVASVFWAQN